MVQGISALRRCSLHGSTLLAVRSNGGLTFPGKIIICKSSVFNIFRLRVHVLYFAFSIRDVPVEHNPQYLLLLLYVRINSTQHITLECLSLAWDSVINQIFPRTGVQPYSAEDVP